MRNPEECIGKRIRQNCGLIAECIAFRNAHDADFRFDENEDLALGKKYSDFERGMIGSPTQKRKILQQKAQEKYIGQEKTTPTGHTARIVDYLGKNENGVLQVRVEWLDDHTKTVIDVSSWVKNQFAKDEHDRRIRIGTRALTNSAKVKSEILNSTKKQKNGLLCTVVEYKNANKIRCRYHGDEQYDVWTSAENFRTGHVPYREDPRTINFRRKHDGEKNINNDGDMMQIIKIRHSKDCDVQFLEDGKIKKHVSYQKFANGSLRHPNKPALHSTSTNELVLLYYLEPFGFRKKKISEEPIKGHEFDLYHKELQIAIEYDGAIFHAKKVDRDLDKVKKCSVAGIRLFRLREEGLDVRPQDDFINHGNAYLNIDPMLSGIFKKLREYPELKTLSEPNFNKDKFAILEYIHEFRRASKHVGEKRKMKNGQMAELLTYTRTACDIRFEDGTQVTGTYANFLQGSVGKPNYTATQHQRELRQKALKNEFMGHSIDIPEYKTSASIKDVKIQEHHDGKRMQRGWYFEVVYTNGYTEWVSEKRIRSGRLVPGDNGHLHERSNIGMDNEMEIIAYRSADDITVRFRSGTVREHMAYNNFKKGNINDPKNNYRQQMRKRRLNELKQQYIGKIVYITADNRTAIVSDVQGISHHDGVRMQYQWEFLIKYENGETELISEYRLKNNII